VISKDNNGAWITLQLPLLVSCGPKLLHQIVKGGYDKVTY